MDYPNHIFRSYDIRGIYPDDLNEAAAYAVGRALVAHTSAKKVFVGRDMRNSGESLIKELIRGITDSGADVDVGGLVPIDFLYWAVPKHEYDAGVVVTASHNPKEYNGFKMVGNGGSFIRGLQIRDVIEGVDEDTDLKKADKKGSVTEIDSWKEYIDHVLSFVDTSKIKKLKVVVDAGNGMAGKVIPQLAPHLPIKITELFFDLDGDFPNRSSNPLDPGATDALKAKVTEVGADLGVAFDADTDRLFFIDETGEFVQADMTLLVLAKHFLSKEPGVGIAYNLVCSRAVHEFIEQLGGKPLRAAVGYINVREAMQEGEGIMGGEVSAHYSFRDNYYADSGFIAFLILLQVISEDGRNLSEIIEEFQRYCRGDEVNFTVEDKEQMMSMIEAQYNDAKIDKLDGVTFSYKKWWFNVRPSNTEPLLRVTVEAEDCKMMEKKRNELAEYVESQGGKRH